ncbi:hypothetical protein [Saccharothrix variisporea]|uniref:Uncharacterized protein n=1 Tax=Saccharothrix variisporea TaxID=543527 RepID=A0A495X1E0_9PSEU|nr:hypothetical protein [Saccharothrix variisporea]RKT67782.1 hypothetical protein DFJ66_0958 [Saccharothrix variisporea]
MGMYVAVRGWLEFDHSQRPRVEEVLGGSGGWAWPTHPFGWTLYLLYGGDLRESAVGALRAQVDELARLEPADADGDMPAGFFLLSDERQQSTTWIIRDGSVIDAPAPAELHWFAQRE